MKLLSRRASALTLPDKVARLRQPPTYPDRPSRIEAVETHMSWVFLTERHAYKLKKPVRYDYLDFSTLAARRKNCTEEVRLNQSLAPGVYLGVVALALDARGTVRLEGDGKAVEWLVKMRRLPADRMLDYQIRQGTISPADVHAAAESLAYFYRECTPLKLDGGEYRAQCARQVDINRQALANPGYALPAALVETVHEAQSKFLSQAPALFERRAAESRIVEGHGDLRPEHVSLESRPVIFDRLEFNRAFRIIDAADELAFLAMECERLGAPPIGEEFFGVYRRITGDHPPPQLVYFYKAYRACLRARLAIWHVHDVAESAWPRWRAAAEEYLRLAESYSGKF